MLSLLTQSVSNASFGIYFPKFTGTIYELLSAPVSYIEIAASLCRRRGEQVDHPRPDHPGDGRAVRAAPGRASVLDAALPGADGGDFSLFGFIIGIWADNFEKLQLVPLLIITPLTFLGGSFYSINMLPPIWQTITLFNPVVYLVSGFRWSFYDVADVAVGISLFMTLLFLAVFLAVVAWIFKTGYRLKT
jgi:ABC-2 type transport system permease protein